MHKNYRLILLLISSLFLSACVSKKIYTDLEAKQKDIQNLLNVSTLKLNSTLKANEILNETYTLPVQQISDATPFDQSTINKNNIICDYEQLIRDNFKEYQLYINDKNVEEIWFYNYLSRIRNNIFGGDAYLLEIFSIDYSDPDKIKCTVKYFDSLEKKIGMLQETNERGHGINKLRTLIQNCNG